MAEVAIVGPGRPVVTASGWDAIHDTSTVFFVPDWEREWYLALGTPRRARAATDPRDAARSGQAAEHHRETYVARAPRPPAADPWVAIAKRRLDEARGERVAAGKRAGKLTPQRDTGRTWDDD